MAKKPKSKRATKMELVAAAISACKDRKGDIRPKAVVEAARDPANILHGEFEWDREKLVQQALEARAADLIRQCREFIDYGEREIAFPMYISNPKSVDSSYTQTVTIARNAGLKRLALQAEVARIKSAIHRAMSLAIVFGMQDRLRQLLDEVVKIESEFGTE